MSGDVSNSGNLCGNCIHWQHSEFQLNWEWLNDDEECFPGLDNYGWCDKITNQYEYRPPDVYGPRPGQEMAYAEDCEDYLAYLTTRRDFGCVQFAAKEQGNDNNTQGE